MIKARIESPRLANLVFDLLFPLYYLFRVPMSLDKMQGFGHDPNSWDSTMHDTYYLIRLGKE